MNLKQLEELFKEEEEKTNPYDELFNKLCERMKQATKKGKIIIIDSTGKEYETNERYRKRTTK